MLLLFCCCRQKEDIKTLKLGHALDPGHSVHMAMVKMASTLDSLSDGKMKIDIYPSQQLGNERELLELIQIGALDMTKTSAAVLENFSPLMQILSMPYLFEDRTHELKVLNGELGRRILEGGTDYYLRGLCFYDAGKRSFYTIDKKVTSPDDLKGLKIRVQTSNTAIQLMRSFGAAATPIPFGELYTALQQGVVDGAENNPPSFYLTRHYEVCNYYIIDEHTSIPDVLIISEHTWKELDEAERNWITEAAMISASYQRELWADSEKDALEAVKKAGVEIIYPDKALFSSRVENLPDKLITNNKVREVYNQIKEVGDD